MAGMIVREDIQKVRETTRIEDIVGQHVTLKSAGVGSLKGLCPFHDERTPSFHVRPQLGYWHCFGCNEGGDVINFVMKVDQLSFTEAVEYLAGKSGIELHYQGGSRLRREDQPGRRQRLLEMHQLAEEFYQSRLESPEAEVGRQFLSQRNFDDAALKHFGVGYSPPEWDSLTRFLRSRSFTDAELTTSGLAVAGSRGLYDRFRDRLMWPIRDLTGATIGFGARRLGDEADSPKYLNTPETPIYHKSKVLYGLDLAKREVVKQRRIVVVEGYTDVMAAHLAGETTAVATCGTAFGSDHVAVVRRLLGDGADPAAGISLTSGKSLGGEVIFTFDGDEAGRNAARKVYVEDQKFAAQTFVAVDAGGMDPCDLRLTRGDGALRQLIDSRIPLFEFVLRSVLDQMRLDTAEGRVAGLRAAAPVLAGIRDVALRGEYVREVAGWLGSDVATVRRAVSQVSRGRGTPRKEAPRYHDDPLARREQQALQALLQRPLDMVGSGFEQLTSDAYTVPLHRGVHEAIQAAGGLERYLDFLAAAEAELSVGDESVNLAGRRWLEAIKEESDPVVAEAITQLAVGELPQDEKTSARDFAIGAMHALVRIGLTRSIADLRAKLQRLEPDDPTYREVFEKLLATEEQRRVLSES